MLDPATEKVPHRVTDAQLVLGWGRSHVTWTALTNIISDDTSVRVISKCPQRPNHRLSVRRANRVHSSSINQDAIINDACDACLLVSEWPSLATRPTSFHILLLFPDLRQCCPSFVIIDGESNPSMQRLSWHVPVRITRGRDVGTYQTGSTTAPGNALSLARLDAGQRRGSLFVSTPDIIRSTNKHDRQRVGCLAVAHGTTVPQINRATGVDGRVM